MKPPGTDQPLLLSVEVVRGDDHLSGVHLAGPSDVGCLDQFVLGFEKGNVDEPAVSRRRAGGVAVEVVLRFERCADDDLLPEDVTSAGIDAEQGPFESVFEAGNQEDRIVPDDRRAVTGAGNRRLPDDVLAGRPVPAEGDILLAAGAIAARPPPPGPVFSLRG